MLCEVCYEHEVPEHVGPGRPRSYCSEACGEIKRALSRFVGALAKYRHSRTELDSEQLAPIPRRIRGDLFRLANTGII